MSNADVQQGSPWLQNEQNSSYTINCAAPGSCSNRPQCWSCRNLSPWVIPFKLMGLCLRSVELSICVCVCWSRPRATRALARGAPCLRPTLFVLPSRPSGRTAPEWAVKSLRKTPKLGEVRQWFTAWHPFLWVSPEQKSQQGFKMGNYGWMCRPLEEMENKHPAPDRHARCQQLFRRVWLFALVFLAKIQLP